MLGQKYWRKIIFLQFHGASEFPLNTRAKHFLNACNKKKLSECKIRKITEKLFINWKMMDGWFYSTVFKRFWMQLFHGPLNIVQRPDCQLWMHKTNGEKKINETQLPAAEVIRLFSQSQFILWFGQLVLLSLPLFCFSTLQVFFANVIGQTVRWRIGSNCSRICSCFLVNFSNER